MASKSKITSNLRFNIDVQLGNLKGAKKQLENLMDSGNLTEKVEREIEKKIASLKQLEKKLSKVPQAGVSDSNDNIKQYQKEAAAVAEIINSIQALKTEALKPHYNKESLNTLKKENEIIKEQIRLRDAAAASLKKTGSSKAAEERIQALRKEKAALKDNAKFQKLTEEQAATTRNFTGQYNRAKKAHEQAERYAKAEERINQITTKGEARKEEMGRITKEEIGKSITDKRVFNGQKKQADKAAIEQEQILTEAINKENQARQVALQIREREYDAKIKKAQSDKAEIVNQEKVIALTKKQIEQSQSKIATIQKNPNSQFNSKEVAITFDKIQNEYGNSANVTSENIEKATRSTTYWGDALDQLKDRAMIFTSFIYLSEKAVQILNKAAQQTKEIDKDMTQIGLVLEQTSSEAWKNFDSYSQMASRLSTTTSEVTAAMKLFYQQGLNTVDVNKMVEASAVAAALGETTLAEASETLTSIVNSYNLTANEASQVTDKISQVAIVSAADFGEISTAIEKVASSAASAGLDLDHMMGILAKMIETTREAPTNIGTALKTIVANFAKFKENPNFVTSDGTTINDVDESLATIGIQLKNAEGQQRDLGEVVVELGGKWDQLTRNQKSYLATTIAGTRQQSRFYAIMNNFDRTLELINESANSSGKSTEQFALYQDSLTASTKRAKNEFEKFYNKVAGGDKVLKGGYDLLTNLLKVINKLGVGWSVLGAVIAQKGIRNAFSYFKKIKTVVGENIKLASNFQSVIETMQNKNQSASQTIANSSFGTTNQLRVNGIQNAVGGTVSKTVGNFIHVDQKVESYNKLNQVSELLENKTIDVDKAQEMLGENFKLQGQTITKLIETEDGYNLVLNKGKTVALKDAVATQKNTAGHAILTTVKWGEVAAQLALNLAIGAGVALVGAGVSMIVKATKAEHEHAIQAQESANKAINEANEIETLGNAYLDLKRKIQLNDNQRKELQKTEEQLLDEFPDLIAGYDAEGRAIAKNTEYIEEQIKAKKLNAAIETEAAAQAVNNDKKSGIRGYRDKNDWYVGVSQEKEDEVFGDANKQAIANLQNSLKGIKPSAFSLTNGLSNKGVLREMLVSVEESISQGRYEDADQTITDLEQQTYSLTGKKKFGDLLKDFQNIRGQIKIVEKTANESAADLLNKTYATKIANSNLDQNQELILNQMLSTNIGPEIKNKNDEEIKKWIQTDGQNFVQTFLDSVTNEGSLEKYKDFIEVSNDSNASYEDFLRAYDQLGDSYKTLADKTKETIDKTYETAAKIMLGLGDIEDDKLNEDQKKEISNLKGQLSGYNTKKISKFTELYNSYGDSDSGKQNKKYFNDMMERLSKSSYFDSFMEDYENLDSGSLTDVKEFKRKYAEKLKAIDIDTEEKMKTIRSQGSYYGEDIAKKYGEREQDLTSIRSGNINLNNRKVAYDNDGNYMTENSITFTKEVDGVFTDYIIPTIIDGVQKTDEEAIAHFEKTGEYIAALSGEDEKKLHDISDHYANEIHLSQEKKYSIFATNINKILDELVNHSYMTAKDIAEKFGKGAEQLSQEGESKHGYDYKNILSGNIDQTKAMEQLQGDDFGTLEIQGTKLIATGREIADSYNEAYDSVMDSLQEVETKSVSTIETQKEKLQQLFKGIDLNDTEAVQQAYEGMSRTTKKQVDLITQAIRKEEARIGKVKELEKQYSDVNSASGKIREAINNNTHVLTSISGVQAMTKDIKGLASAWQAVNEGGLSQLDIINMVANNSDLLTALDTEGGKLVLQKEKLEELGKARLQEAKTTNDMQIKIVETQIAEVEAGAATTQQDLDNIEQRIKAEYGLADTTVDVTNRSQDAWQNLATAMASSGRAMGITIGSLITLFNNYHKAQEEGTGEDTGVKTGGGTTNHTNKVDKGNGLIIDKEKTLNRLKEELKKLKSIGAGISNYENNIGKLFQDANGEKGQGKGGKDKYESSVEHLEHFYNYLRKIESLEAKINKMKTKTSILDLTNNYNIESLKEQNGLLKQQANLYSQYVNEEANYLKTLQQQLKNTYGDWVYFTKEGVVQVTQTDFLINSESEEKRYKGFSELLEEYESQYKTYMDSQNTLLETQQQIIENIKTSYEKINQELTDVLDNLDYMNSISDHNVEMSVGNLKQIMSYNQQLSTTLDMYRYAASTLKSLKSDMAQITNLINAKGFQQFVDWNADTNQYQTSSAFNEGVIQGNIDGETVTMVQALVAASQTLNEQWRDINSKVMEVESTLKTIVESRLDTIAELFGSWQEELEDINSLINRELDIKNTIFDLTGYKTGDLEQKYKLIANAAAMTKTSWEEMKKLASKALKEITDNYNEYVTMINGEPFINETAIEESSKLTDEQKAKAKELIATYKHLKESTDSLEDSTYEYLEALKELQENQLQQTIEVLQKVHDELKEIDQEQLNDLKEKYDKMNDLDNEYYSNLSQRINDARNQRNQLQNQQEFVQKQQRLSALQQDSSGAYNSQIIGLQKEINDMAQSRADANVDNELERIKREQEERAKDREVQIQQLENLIAFKDENGIYWQQANEMLQQGYQVVSSFLANREQNNDQSELATQEAIAQTNQQLADVYARLGDYNAQDLQTSADIKTMLNDFINGDGNSVGGLLNKLGLLDTDINSNLTNSFNSITNVINNGFAQGLTTIQNGYSEFWNQFDQLKGNINGNGTGIIDALNYARQTASNDAGTLTGLSRAIANSSASTNENARRGADNAGSAAYAGVTSSGYIRDMNNNLGNYSYNIDQNTFQARNTLWTIKDKLMHGWRISQGELGLTGSFLGGLGLTLGGSYGKIYKTGGYANYTGPAWVDGTKTKPEAFLNAKQTQLFEQLRDNLTTQNVNNNTHTTQNKNENTEIVNIDNLAIQVKEVADTDTIDKVVKTVKKSIYSDATKKNVMQVRRR